MTKSIMTTDGHDDKDGAHTPGGLLGNWALVCSIGLGSLVVGVFVPVFLLISAGCVLLLALVLKRSKALYRTQIDALVEESKLNEELIRSAGSLRSILNSADVPILATDEHGNISHLNTHCLEVLGITEASIGRAFDEMMTQQILHELESFARRNEPGHARCLLPIHGEMRSFDVSADLIPATNGAVLTFRDITELSGAMKLKADFVANASHELRTPIASIKGAIETLGGPAKNDEKMSARLIEMIGNNADRLEGLATDLLDLSRLESEAQPPTIELVNISDLIDTICADLSPMADRRGLRLKPEVGSGICEVLSDRSMLSLMIRNLVGNAIKFAHQGTTIRVVIERETIAIDRTAPVPRTLDRKMGLKIRVIDRGVGIPIAQQQRVFERFYQVNESRTGSGALRGTGLGLAIVKHASKRLGGWVTLESVHQEGTTVSIGLPGCVD